MNNTNDKQKLVLYPQLVKSLTEAAFLLNSARYFMVSGSASDQTAERKVRSYQTIIDKAKELEHRHAGN